MHGAEPDPGLSCSATIRRDHSVAPPTEPEGRSGVLVDESALRLQHLGPHGSQSQGSQPTPIRTGKPAEQESQSEINQGQEQGQDPSCGTDQLTSPRAFDRDVLQDKVAHAIFANSDNWCFANSAVTSLLWLTLSIKDFDFTIWGEHCNTLHDFVHKISHQTGVLTQEPWIHQVLQCWGRFDPDNPGRISQQDAAEFIGTWLEVMKSPAFDLRWERRIEAEGATHLVDESASTRPIFLQFAPIHTHLPRCALSDLIQVWHLTDGMKAALTSSSMCVCVHVDRCVHLPQTGISKCHTIIDTEVDCLLPIFMNDTLDSGLLEYTIVAIQAHLGGDAQGHYRAAVRIHPTVTQGPAPSSWLICDDWQRPTTVWTLPEWMLQNATIFWLLRSDSLHLHQYVDPVQDISMPSSIDAMLALLKPLDPPV